MAEGEVAGPGQQSWEAPAVQRVLRQKHQGACVHDVCVHSVQRTFMDGNAGRAARITSLVKAKYLLDGLLSNVSDTELTSVGYCNNPE